MDSTTRQRAVAIGGSTGALPAMRALLSGLPPSPGAAIFLTLHVGSEGGNLLAKVLADAGPIPLKTAEDGEPVADDIVYVAPADHHLLVIDGLIRLGHGPRENLARPAIDPLFRSVGASYRSGAIGVLLSGKLNDGASGLADLKQCGGVTVVQNPADAIADDMPMGGLEASNVDHRAPAAKMGDLLAQLLAQEPDHPPPVPDAVLLEIDIAIGRPCLTQDIATLADPAPLSCPSCGGVLSQVRAPPLRFRCQVGHAFTAQVLQQEKEDSLDEAMRVALRILEERAELIDRLARDSDRSGRSHSARDFSRKAEELRSQADVLRRAALRSVRKISG